MSSCFSTTPSAPLCSFHSHVPWAHKTSSRPAAPEDTPVRSNRLHNHGHTGTLFRTPAPSSILSEHGYGKGYQYAHDYEDGYSGQECLPERLAGRKFYEPTGHGYEKSIMERMEW